VSLERLFSFHRPAPDHDSGPDPHVEHVVRRPLNRVLAFIGRTIDDVVNDPLVKNQVYGYYKLHRQIERTSEIRELERQWNPTV
jgi:hypothetical protein